MIVIIDKYQIKSAEQLYIYLPGYIPSQNSGVRIGRHHHNPKVGQVLAALIILRVVGALGASELSQP